GWRPAVASTRPPARAPPAHRRGRRLDAPRSTPVDTVGRGRGRRTAVDTRGTVVGPAAARPQPHRAARSGRGLGRDAPDPMARGRPGAGARAVAGAAANGRRRGSGLIAAAPRAGLRRTGEAVAGISLVRTMCRPRQAADDEDMSTRSATANRTMRRALAAAAVLTLPVTTAATATAAPSASVSNPPVDRPDDLSRQVLESAQAAGARTLQRGPGQDTRRDLDAAVDGLVQDGAVGVTARVETPGQEWRGAAGSRELDHAPPAHPQDRFRIGSITKPMVATLVMQEVERGSLSLATPVADIVPGLLPDAVGGEVTVEQLLSHRSGAPEFLAPATLARLDDPEAGGEVSDVLGEERDDARLVAARASRGWRAG